MGSRSSARVVFDPNRLVQDISNIESVVVDIANDIDLIADDISANTNTITNSTNEIISKIEENKGLKPSEEYVANTIQQVYPENDVDDLLKSCVANTEINKNVGLGDIYLNCGMLGPRNVISQINAAANEYAVNKTPYENIWVGWDSKEVVKYGREKLAYGERHRGYVKEIDLELPGGLTPTGVPTKIYDQNGTKNDLNTYYFKLQENIGLYIKAYSGDIIISHNTTIGMFEIINSFPWQNKDAFITSEFHWTVDGEQIDMVTDRLAAYNCEVKAYRDKAPYSMNTTQEQMIKYYVDLIEAVHTDGHYPRFLCLDAVHWASGYNLDIGKIATACKAKAKTLGYQLVCMFDGAHSFIDTTYDFSPSGNDKDVDFYVAPFHKVAQSSETASFIYYKNGYKNALGLFGMNAYLWFQYTYSPGQIGAAGGNQFYTDVVNFRATPNSYTSEYASLILSGYEAIAKKNGYDRGSDYLKSLTYQKTRHFSGLCLKEFGYQAFISPLVSTTGIAKKDLSDLDPISISHFTCLCPGRIDLLNDFKPGGKYAVGKVFSNGDKIGHDSLLNIMFWNDAGSNGKVSWNAGDVVTYEAWNEDDYPNEAPRPYMKIFGSGKKVTTWAQKMWSALHYNGIITRALNSKLQCPTEKYSITTVPNIFGGGNIVFGKTLVPPEDKNSLINTEAKVIRTSSIRFTYDKFNTLDDLTNAFAKVKEIYLKLTDSYNGNKAYFNSWVFSGIYLATPLPESYLFSKVVRARKIRDVPNNPTDPAYSWLGKENGVVDKTGLFRHSGGEDYNPDNKYGLGMLQDGVINDSGGSERRHWLPNNRLV